jgi:hypothetical protein
MLLGTVRPGATPDLSIGLKSAISYRSLAAFSWIISGVVMLEMLKGLFLWTSLGFWLVTVMLLI